MDAITARRALAGGLVCSMLVTSAACSHSVRSEPGRYTTPNAQAAEADEEAATPPPGYLEPPFPDKDDNTGYFVLASLAASIAVGTFVAGVTSEGDVQESERAYLSIGAGLATFGLLLFALVTLPDDP